MVTQEMLKTLKAEIKRHGFVEVRLKTKDLPYWYRRVINKVKRNSLLQSKQEFLFENIDDIALIFKPSLIPGDLDHWLPSRPIGQLRAV